MRATVKLRDGRQCPRGVEKMLAAVAAVRLYRELIRGPLVPPWSNELTEMLMPSNPGVVTRRETPESRRWVINDGGANWPVWVVRVDAVAVICLVRASPVMKPAR